TTGRQVKVTSRIRGHFTAISAHATIAPHEQEDGMSSRRRATLHAMVLPAGASSRFGSPKQLVRFERQPLIQRVIAGATELAGGAVSVVLGAYAAEIAAVLPPGSASIIINRDWQEGIASSIRTGVSRLPGACHGVLLLPAG